MEVDIESLCYTSSSLNAYDVTKEHIMWYLLSSSAWMCSFLLKCFLLMIEEMGMWYLSTLFLWHQFVLAKNLLKGEIVENLKYWPHFC